MAAGMGTAAAKAVMGVVETPEVATVVGVATAEETGTAGAAKETAGSWRE
jgi:hypothetical protein